VGINNDNSPVRRGTVAKIHPDETHMFKFYVDDGYVIAPLHVMEDILNILCDRNTFLKFDLLTI
jgi:hypothetical protein